MCSIPEFCGEGNELLGSSRTKEETGPAFAAFANDAAANVPRNLRREILCIPFQPFLPAACNFTHLQFAAHGLSNGWTTRRVGWPQEILRPAPIKCREAKGPDRA